MLGMAIAMSANGVIPFSLNVQKYVHLRNEGPDGKPKQHFIKIPEAFKILSDTDKRRKYDSTVECAQGGRGGTGDWQGARCPRRRHPTG